MVQEKWFCTPIWFDNFQEDMSVAAEKCLELQESGYPNRFLSNIGGWQSCDIDLSKFDAFIGLQNIIDRCIKEVSVSISQKLKCRLDNVWININKKGDYNTSHVHPNTSLSGVLYLQADENSGRMVFFRDYSAQKHYPLVLGDEVTIFSNYAYYKPTPGLALVFPAWLDHFVESSNSDLPRISIAFNIKQYT